MWVNPIRFIELQNLGVKKQFGSYLVQFSFPELFANCLNKPQF